MPTKPLLLLFVAHVALFSCVKPKIYRHEVELRKKSEARETVLLREMADRKKEVASLTKEVGELNRQLGTQDEQIRYLKTEVAARSQQFGESSNKLAARNALLEADVARLRDTIARLETTMASMATVQEQQVNTLLSIFSPISAAYDSLYIAGVSVDFSGDELALALPDAELFESNGLAVSMKGLDLLAPLAGYLLQHPELKVDIHAHTDNTLPKNKGFADTWDWSLARATNVARALVRDMNVNANQLTPVGKGEFTPLASNETAEGRAQNRRTIIVFRPELPMFESPRSKY